MTDETSLPSLASSTFLPTDFNTGASSHAVSPRQAVQHGAVHPAAVHAGRENACGEACPACQGKHVRHTCGKARLAKKRRTHSTPRDGEQDDDLDAAKYEDKDEKRDEANARPVRRTLTPIPQIGLGHDQASGAQDIGASLPTPWWMRANNANASHGPFGDTACVAWMRDRHAQQYFAQRFSAPLLEEVPMRSISCDRPSAHAQYVAKDYTSKALFAVTQTHRPTWLDIPRTKTVSDLCVPQFHCDRRSALQLDGGPNGGAALADCWLWKMSATSDVLVTDSEILKLVDYIAQGIRGDPDVGPLWPAIATEWTEPLKANGRQPVLRGGRYVNEKNMAVLQQHLPFSTSRDINPHLLDRIVRWRASRDHGFDVQEFDEFEDGKCITCVPMLPCGLDDKRIVPTERAINDPAAQSKSVHALDEQPHEVQVDRLFDLFLYVDVFHGTDAEDNCRQIKLDGIYLRAKMPGVEPLLALKQMAKEMPGMGGPLESTLRHMAMVLGKASPTSITTGSVFTAGGRVDAAELCCEAHMPLALFSLADREGISDVNMGGLRIDMHDQEELQCYETYLAHVEHARRQHYRLVEKGVSMDLSPHGVRHAHKPDPSFRLPVAQGLPVLPRRAVSKHAAGL
jgi:hypothetical protein